uniref:Mucin-1 n=1 Tax=Panthera tigris altaica TaxID=74533 RepID=A0A8C9KN62_PANTA
DLSPQPLTLITAAQDTAGTSPASHSARTTTSATNHSVEPVTSSNHKTSPQLSIRISFFFLSFSISNLQFNSCLEDPNTGYYQELYNSGRGPCGEGSVVVECTLAFRQGTTDALNVRTRLDEHRAEAARYGMSISSVRVRDASFPSAAGSGSGVPGWGIALLVLVCVLLALAVTVCQCRRKNCGQLDLFPPRDAYHPMSEYPTYHTHGRYIPPGSTRRSPYEEVRVGLAVLA